MLLLFELICKFIIILFIFFIYLYFILFSCLFFFFLFVYSFYFFLTSAFNVPLNALADSINKFFEEDTEDAHYGTGMKDLSAQVDVAIQKYVVCFWFLDLSLCLFARVLYLFDLFIIVVVVLVCLVFLSVLFFAFIPLSFFFPQDQQNEIRNMVQDYQKKWLSLKPKISERDTLQMDYDKWRNTVTALKEKPHKDPSMFVCLFVVWYFSKEQTIFLIFLLYFFDCYFFFSLVSFFIFSCIHCFSFFSFLAFFLWPILNSFHNKQQNFPRPNKNMNQQKICFKSRMTHLRKKCLNFGILATMISKNLILL